MTIVNLTNMALHSWLLSFINMFSLSDTGPFVGMGYSYYALKFPQLTEVLINWSFLYKAWSNKAPYYSTPSPACCFTLPVSWLKEGNYVFPIFTEKTNSAIWKQSRWGN
ncbi:hypothetical protein CHARACLAT_022088 [Characodon lateralis]|uniref:Uncharacterized protein n=1 Tax=Characodon lateralis TaxID=208331 RepID=A0ABU7E2H0_9TELE|nr:hypothetical protein [Characodon lateralis]